MRSLDDVTERPRTVGLNPWRLDDRRAMQRLEQSGQGKPMENLVRIFPLPHVG